MLNIYFAWKPDSLQLADAAGDEEDDPQPVLANNKRAKKSEGRRGGKTARAPAPLESPQKRKQAVGVRTRRQAQQENEDDVMVKQEDADEVVKKEDDSGDDFDLGLPSINDIVKGRS